MEITLADVFELNRVLHILFEQELKYDIKTAYKLYKLINELDDIERFFFERIQSLTVNGNSENDNTIKMSLLMSKVMVSEISLTLDELMSSDDVVNISSNDIIILDKILNKNK